MYILFVLSVEKTKYIENIISIYPYRILMTEQFAARLHEMATEGILPI